MTKYRYGIRNTRHSSERFGPCEVCGKHVSEVFRQSEEKEYTHGERTSWTTHGCRDLFGHEQCLIGQRKSTGEDNPTPASNN